MCPYRVADVLARDLVLQLDGEDGQTVEEDAHIERFFVLLGELQLPLEVQEVFLVQPTALLRHRVGRLEIAQVEMAAAVDVKAFAQGVQRAFFVHHFLDAFEQIATSLTDAVAQLAIVVPLLGLGGTDERNHRLGPQTQGLVVVLLPGGAIAMRLQQDGFDVFFKGVFGGDLSHG